MSQKDRDRLKVLHEAERGHLTQKQAGGQLKLSERWVRKLLARLRQEGDRGILHRLRGRVSKRRLPEAVRQKVVKLVKREYADFGPSLAAEYLAEQHGVQVSKETLRQLLMAAGVLKRKRRRVEEVHVWRARRACWGELVQWDTSEHDWLEGRGPKLYLLAMIDDATSRVLARFAAQDTTQENFRLLASYLPAVGTPAGVLHRQGQHVHRESTAEGSGGRGLARGFDADRAGASRAGDRLGASPLAASQGAGGTVFRDGPGPPGEGPAQGGSTHPGGSQPVLGARVLAAVE